MNADKWFALLLKFGYRIDRYRGGHAIFKRTGSPQLLSISAHDKDLSRGMVCKIRKALRVLGWEG